MMYRLIGKEKLTGNIIYTPWYLATTLIEVVAYQMEMLSNLAYNVNIEYKECEA